MENQRLEKILAMLEASPGDEFLLYAAGIEFQTNGNLEKAETYYLELLNINPEYVGAFYQLGKLFEAQDKMEEALSWFQKGMEIAKAKGDKKTEREMAQAIEELE